MLTKHAQIYIYQFYYIASYMIKFTEWLFVRVRTHTSMAIRSALNDFHVGFTSMVGVQAKKGRVRVRVGLGTSFMAYNITHSNEEYIN